MAAKGAPGTALDRLPAAGKAVFAVVLLGLVFAVYFVVFFGELMSAIEAAQNQEKSLSAQLKTAQQSLEAYNKDVQEKAALEARAADLKKVLPETSEAPAFLSSIQAVATISGVTLRGWSPLEESPQEFYAKIPMKLVLAGKFHQLARFFFGVGQLDRIINLENIVLKTVTKGAPAADVELDCEALATAFRTLRSGDEGGKRQRR